MLSPLSILIFSTLLVNFAQCGILAPCHINDQTCFEKSVNAALPQLLSADPSLGIDSSDPLAVATISGDFPMIKFTLMNPVTTGFKNCDVKNLNINLDAETLHFDLNCPSLHTTGKYDISGRLILLPIEGNGDFDMTTGQYNTIVDAELKQVKGADGKAYLSINSFKLKNQALGPIKFDFKNLFNGNKEQASNLIKFANENWKDVADLLQDPVWYSNMKKIIGNVDKYLKTEPIDEIFLP
ncbi:unnamed protein product [Leptosia nina]|uniref:Uncharacterized protein n=1 Tax=Leptosia nina TaxID=320188 RepID=A0AAV1K2A8_9NEOP